MQSIHQSVLLKESIKALHLPSGKRATVLDGTFGGGGHSMEALEHYPALDIIALDRDQDALNRGEEELKDYRDRIRFFCEDFRNLDKVLAEAGVAEVDGILLDLGLSSDQLGPSGRGFSFLREEPLLMTMSAHPSESDLTAMDIVNDWAEEDIANVIYAYGEERYARRIAKAIIEARNEDRIATSTRLAEIVSNAVPSAYKRGRIHPATKTFQALRIAVNDELESLEFALRKGFERLKLGGAFAIITFHSLEDRIVKNFFREWVREGKGEYENNKKKIIPSTKEIKNNPRSRSAKLRVLYKINQ